MMANQIGGTMLWKYRELTTFFQLCCFLNIKKTESNFVSISVNLSRCNIFIGAWGSVVVKALLY